MKLSERDEQTDRKSVFVLWYVKWIFHNIQIKQIDVWENAERENECVCVRHDEQQIVISKDKKN